ncbi:MAG: HAD hydrolase-like protein [Lachnospiraceae bacterium]|nr:HAD hydrolase-like protein [Clostridiales bacterium]MCC8141162.1 HAD hydrolase-like protein [Lachnospiraceae bacterium]
MEKTKQLGSQLGMERIEKLMHELNDLQDKIPVIHIGGTNGKGSVGAMLSSVLAEAGYRVGWFNTPDVFSYEEEWRIDGEPIACGRLAQVLSRVKDACDRLTKQGLPHPTRFEVETAAAFVWFSEEDCDIILLEVGMGGEGDATNVVRRPLVTVLTSIGMDHTQFLGDTLPEIARVKAGIIKPGTPVVSVRQAPEVMDVIRERCESAGAPLFISEGESSPRLHYSNGELTFIRNGEEITLGLRGLFQIENAECALKVLEVLSGQDASDRQRFEISDDAISRGMATVRWPGRYERIDKTGDRDGSGPVILLDGAHNESAAIRLRESLDRDFPNRRILYIMGVLADKDHSAMAKAMFRPGDLVYTVTPSDPRALPAKDLAGKLREKNIDAVPCESMRDAAACARAEAGADDVILAFGSLSYLREVREAFRKKYRYILWDMDGTIVDTYEGVSRSLKPALERYGINTEKMDYYNFIGPPLRVSLPKYAGVPKEHLEEVIDVFHERYQTIGVYECSLFPGVREAFIALHDAGYIQMIASSKPEEQCKGILKKFELADLLDDVVGASLDGRIDTKMEVLEEAFRRIGEADPQFRKDEVVLIGDTKYDADGAVEAGIDCIGVAYGFGGKEELKEHGAAVIFDDLDALTEEFLNLHCS